ncbi:hypothetical protein R1sor_014728 [Riccia sorocarpa]|uniref:Phosphoesterase n=1 Tax=Riccia sorocarpa TaxID=122646 RepID=A0ABD3HE33_9MARC
MEIRSVVVLFQLLIYSTLLSSFSAYGNAESPIKTVVVLVMENRSFDHMLGWLKRLNPEIDGLTGTESNPVNASDPNSKRVFISDRAEFVDPDPGHSFQAIREQVFGSKKSVDDEARGEREPPRMNGFVEQAREMNHGPDFSERVMSAFRPEVIPVTAALAMEFAVFDRWFASAPTSTQPNRMYVHSATSHGAISNVPWNLTAGYPQKTIFESLEAAGLSWNVYYQNIPATLFFKELRKLKNLFKFKPYSPWFDIDCKMGALASYVVIEQRYFDLKTDPANDDHPSHDVAEGQKLIKEVYEKLRASPQWNETFLLITYDEHGGFYDHIPTPVTHIPNPDGMNASYPEFFAFNRLGVRVPTIAISPWINKGLGNEVWISCSKVFFTVVSCVTWPFS